MASSKKDAKPAKAATKISSPRSQGSTPKTKASAGTSAKSEAKASPLPVKAASKAPVAAVKASASAAKADAAPVKAKTTASTPPGSSAVKTRPETVKAAAAASAAKPATPAVAAKTAVAASATKSLKSVAADKPHAAPADTQANKGGKSAKASPPAAPKLEAHASGVKADPAVISTNDSTHVKAAAPAASVAAKPAVSGKPAVSAGTGAGKVETVVRPVGPTLAKSPEKTAPAKSPESVVASTSPAIVKATVDAKTVAPAVAKPRPVATKLGFKLNEYIVYPAHGVGQIISVETQEVAGFSLELYVVSFIKDKMILKVPTSKVATVGMRKLAETNIVEKALSTLSGRARIKRTMWSRRAQEYEAKINSGDLVTIAEVVRDLYRSDTQPEQSYSERQLYEAALDRMAREIAAVRRLIDSEALKLIEAFLQKGPKRGAKSDAEGDGDGETEAEDIDDSADVDAAA